MPRIYLGFDPGMQGAIAAVRRAARGKWGAFPPL